MDENETFVKEPDSEKIEISENENKSDEEFENIPSETPSESEETENSFVETPIDSEKSEGTSTEVQSESSEESEGTSTEVQNEPEEKPDEIFTEEPIVSNNLDVTENEANRISVNEPVFSENEEKTEEEKEEEFFEEVVEEKPVKEPKIKKSRRIKENKKQDEPEEQKSGGFSMSAQQIARMNKTIQKEALREDNKRIRVRLKVVLGLFVVLFSVKRLVGNWFGIDETFFENGYSQSLAFKYRVPDISDRMIEFGTTAAGIILTCIGIMLIAGILTRVLFGIIDSFIILLDNRKGKKMIGPGVIARSLFTCAAILVSFATVGVGIKTLPAPIKETTAFVKNCVSLQKDYNYLLENGWDVEEPGDSTEGENNKE